MSPRVRRALGIVANVGLTLALLLASVPFGMRAWGHFTQAAARRAFEEKARPVRSAALRRAAQAPARNPLRIPARRRFEMCVLQIPSIGVDAVVEEGNVNWTLLPGPGHEPGSPGPGGRGNCIIAAHRNMWEATFADLPNVKPGDTVVLTDSHGIYTYRVDTSGEVGTRDRRALSEGNGARVTLYTCVEPFSETHRYVVRAHLVDAYFVEG